MKERSLLLSAPMVLETLKDIKGQTRRAFKGELLKCIAGRELVHVLHGKETSILTCRQPADTAYAGFSYSKPGIIDPVYFKCPYGQPGDRLWVRENYGFGIDFDHVSPSMVPAGMWVWYDADAKKEGYYKGRKRPSIHMPRWASRINLEVTGIRVERLQDISEEDAEAEGVDFLRRVPDADETLTAKQLYFCLWEAINGGGSWEKNPWVWVIEFKRVTP